MDAYEAHALLKVHPGPAVHRKVFLISADGMRQRVRRENGNEIEKKGRENLLLWKPSMLQIMVNET